MNLWIRSQNKEVLIPNPKLSLGKIENEYWIVDLCDDTVLGEYKTKQRTLEVLDEIQNAILGIICLEDIEEQKIKKYTGNAILSKKSNNIVYEMPKE